jgi:hypothetical protein
MHKFMARVGCEVDNLERDVKLCIWKLKLSHFKDHGNKECGMCSYMRYIPVFHTPCHETC